MRAGGASEDQDSARQLLGFGGEGLDDETVWVAVMTAVHLASDDGERWLLADGVIDETVGFAERWPRAGRRHIAPTRRCARFTEPCGRTWTQWATATGGGRWRPRNCRSARSTTNPPATTVGSALVEQSQARRLARTHITTRPVTAAPTPQPTAGTNARQSHAARPPTPSPRIRTRTTASSMPRPTSSIRLRRSLHASPSHRTRTECRVMVAQSNRAARPPVSAGITAEVRHRRPRSRVRVTAAKVPRASLARIGWSLASGQDRQRDQGSSVPATGVRKALFLRHFAPEFADLPSPRP